MRGIDVNLCCCDCFIASALTILYECITVYIHALEHDTDAEGSHVQTVHVAMYVYELH